METISHEGKIFTKATVLAKKYRYTTDYIGQLCRGSKVESKLIGRAWFVTEDSLLKHKSDRYASARLPEILINESLVSDKILINSAPRSILPVLSKTTHRSLPREHHIAIHHEKKPTTQIATYHQDFGVLEPSTFLKKASSEIETKINITKEPSKNIPILLNENAKRSFSFEPLPEVSLQGNLLIQSLDDPDLFTDTKPVSVAEINFTPQTVVKAQSNAKKLPVLSAKPTSVPIKHKPVQPILPSLPSVGVVMSKKSIAIEKFPTAVSVTRVSFLAVPGFVVAAIFLCVGLLSLSSFVESDGLVTRESIKFNLAAVSEVVAKLPSSY